jgi:hypothetical protein
MPHNPQYPSPNTITNQNHPALSRILKNISLNPTPIHPGNKILHAPRNQIRRIRNRLRPNPDMALLNDLRRGLHRLRHPQSRQAAAGESGDRDAVFDARELGGQDADVVQLGEEERFVFVGESAVG